jgi:type II secretory pathway pseudopilin PulG
MLFKYKQRKNKTSKKGFTQHLFAISAKRCWEKQKSFLLLYLLSRQSEDNKSIRLKKGAGFTIIDMLAALGIIVILSGIIATNFNNFRVASNLDSDVEQLSALLRQAQLWSLSGQTRNGVRPTGGWGVHLDECSAGSCTYFLFADLFPTGTANYVYDAGSDDIVSEGVMDNLVEITTLSPVSAASLDIVFSSPSAEIYLNGAQVEAASVITLTHTTSQDQGIVTINRLSGRITRAINPAPPPPPAQCSDSLDNDGDGWFDLTDPGCTDTADDSETDSGTTACNDNIDNDGDTLTDEADPGCSSGLDIDELGTNQCDDGTDNDSDTFTDYPDDDGCTDVLDNDETDPPTPECSDSIDNDGDTLTDNPADPGCIDDFDTSELGTNQCDDGTDNDSDTFTDYPDDVDCQDPSDDDEAPPPVGTVEFNDTFTVSSNTQLSGHTSDSGGTWTELFDVGTAGLAIGSTDDQVRPLGCTNSEGTLYETNSTFSSADYEVSILQSNGSSGDNTLILAARIQDENNMYVFEWNEDGGQIYLRSSGIWSAIGSAVGAIANGSIVTLKVQADNISVLIDSVEATTVTDNTHTAAGNSGLGMGAVVNSTNDCNSNHRVDDFSVTVF